MSVTDKKLVWWRDVPVDVESGLLHYIAKQWQNEVFIVSANKLEADRKKCAWKADLTDKITFVTGPEELQEQQKLITQLLQEDAIHIFSGIRGKHRIFLDQLKKEGRSKNSCILIMESPSLYGRKLKKAIKGFLYPILYRYYNLKYGTMFQAVLTMGVGAKKVYASYGWKENRIFPFMYLPLAECAVSRNEKSVSDVRILYLGRFEYATKGVRILMDALEDIITSTKWTIDFVGGYGAQAEEVIEWCKKTENINYCGTWLSNEAIDKMSEYDFCVAPSLYDGWNMTPYQAIKAGIGCITTDQAGSQELIERSHAGVVVKAGNVDELRQILLEAIENNSVREEWKESAKKFQTQVSEEVVGKYFVDILNLAIGNETADRNIKCPWLR